MEETKVCSSCGEKKPLSEYHKFTKYPPSYCRECKNAKSKKRYKVIGKDPSTKRLAKIRKNRPLIKLATMYVQKATKSEKQYGGPRDLSPLKMSEALLHWILDSHDDIGGVNSTV